MQYEEASHREAGDRSEEDEARKDAIVKENDLKQFLGMAAFVVSAIVAWGIWGK